MKLEYLNKILTEAEEEKRQIKLSEIIKAAALNGVLLDDAIRELRKSISNGEVDLDRFDHDVLMVTHTSEMKAFYNDQNQARFEAEVAKILNQANVEYGEMTGKKLNPEQENQLVSEVKQEMNSRPLMTPFDNDKVKNPYTLR